MPARHTAEGWPVWAFRETEKFLIPVRAVYFSFNKNVQTGSGAYLASYSVGTWGFPGVKAAGGMILGTDFHLALRLRSSGALLLLPLCVFVVTGQP